MATVSSVTILICTYNRATLLRETLAAMQQMKQPEDCAVDIIIVDNNSTDDTATAVAQAARQTRFPITLLQERKQGKSFALNTGLRVATGDVLALTDDDVLPALDWLVKMVDDFRTQDVTFVFGKVLPRWSATPPPELLMPAAQAIWGPLAIVDYGDEPQDYRIDSTGQRLPIGANIGFIRAALIQIGGWRTDLGKVNNTLISGEDHEIFARLRRHGLYTGYYDPAVSVRHYVPASRLTRRYFRKWFYWSGKTHALMLDELFPELNMTTVPRIAGIPRFACRQAFGQLLRYVTTRHGDPLTGMIEELRLLQYLGLFVQCWHRRKFARRQMRRAAAIAAAVVLCGAGSKTLAVVSAAEPVQLAIADGRVTLVARGATLQQILAEWTRVGGTRIDNAETMPAAALNLRFTDAAEEEALQVLLRGANFVLVERPQDARSPAASRIARILIAPRTVPVPPQHTDEIASPAVAMPLSPAASLVQRIIGLDGLPVPDDQTDVATSSTR
jgi:glycosyltransferase involved in cell wall biosynthesis